MTTVVEMERQSSTDDNEHLEAWREIGQRLQDLRARLDEPFAAVAAKAGMMPTVLAAIERGEARMGTKDFKSLLAVLKISQIDFVGDLGLASRSLIMELLETELVTPSSRLEDPAPAMGENVQSVSPIKDAGAGQDTPRVGVRHRRSPGEWGIAREPGQITYYQMHACLRGMFKRTDREKAEVIYSWTSLSDIDVKVFTSVDARTGLARPLGEDAIRIVVYDKRAKRKIVLWSSELRRIGGWQKRLREKVGAAILHASYRPRCPACRQETMIIYGRPEMQFWGCSDYPSCRGTSDLGGEEKPTIPSALNPT